jgi:NAD-specific glutamate dehydrogenase
VEIFVYSPRMEGCHLRGGEVARGGIRWSDRREDFRTEVLGLMKAQMVKNAVIVPVRSTNARPRLSTCRRRPAEIIATVVADALVNRLGPAFIEEPRHAPDAIRPPSCGLI